MCKVSDTERVSVLVEDEGLQGEVVGLSRDSFLSCRRPPIKLSPPPHPFYTPTHSPTSSMQDPSTIRRMDLEVSWTVCARDTFLLEIGLKRIVFDLGIQCLKNPLHQVLTPIECHAGS